VGAGARVQANAAEALVGKIVNLQRIRFEEGSCHIHQNRYAIQPQLDQRIQRLQK
jgi:hypothetical protein